MSYHSISVRLVGCCGAVCGTCRSLADQSCKGCKLGYEEGERDLARARCEMKKCCFGSHGLETCAECRDYSSCKSLNGFYAKSGYKYRKYQEALDFIRNKGYGPFLKIAADWKGAYGIYPKNNGSGHS